MNLSAGKIFILKIKLLFNILIYCFLGTSCNVNGPIFRLGQQTSQDTELWSFGDRDFPSDEESLPVGPRAMQVTETIKEAAVHNHHLDSFVDEEQMTDDTPDNQLALLQTLPSYGRNRDPVSEVFQQQHNLPETLDKFHLLQESRENDDHLNGHSKQLPVPSAMHVPRQPSIQNVDLRREALQQLIGSPGLQSPHRQSIPSDGLEVELFHQQHILNGTSGANFRHQRNQENCYRSESFQQHNIRSGPSSVENSRQQSSINSDLGRQDFNRHLGISGLIDSRQQ
jgi:hypothetical protein